MKIAKKILSATSAVAMLISICNNCGLAVIAETSFSDEVTFSVNIPDNWTNTTDGWVTASEDIKVYFKISDHLQHNFTWGTYSDPDAKEWNPSVKLSETDADGAYIKFWAVKNGIVQNNPEAIHFYYDETAPNNFTVSVNENTEPYTLKSNDIVTDSISGISGIYYSIAHEYNSIDDIVANCVEAITFNDKKGMSFSVECTSDMTGKTVYFYAVDFAGNFQLSNINVDSYMDTSAPSLIVDGIDANTWVNKETRLDTWNVRTDSYGAKVYYKISDTNLLDSWGDYSDATEWSDSAVIPEGENFIHFWAAYESSEREVSEETRFYKYDNTSPQEYIIKPEPKPGRYEFPVWHEPTFYVYGSNIYDALSGISRIYYTVLHNEYVIFEDTNIERIVCEGQKYTPVYTNGREIGEIKPEDINGESCELVSDTYVSQMVYTLQGFTVDGVYSAKLTAYDKAGNKSILNDNTYVRMVDPTVNVLAYIENSNREKSEGWYSFEDENGPISKQPSSFSDLSIVVLSKTNNTHIYLVDKATNASTDTNITDTEDALFDAKMYGVGAYRYTLTGEYFEKNYTADADTTLYLRVENDGEILDLGEMYIDNTDPDCNIPEHFHDWGWFKGSGKQTITFDNISETLDINETIAYVDGETIHLSNIVVGDSSPFSYDEQNNTLSLTLEPGSHKVGLLLVDCAGNRKSISEVQHLAIGNYRIWIGVGSGLGAILLAVLAVFGVKKFKRRRLS